MSGPVHGDTGRATEVTHPTLTYNPRPDEPLFTADS